VQVIDSLKAGHQAMVFVHSRKDTGKTGRTIIQKAQNSSDTAIFDVTEHPQWAFVSRDVKKSRNKCVNLHHCLQPMLTVCA
jgi:activating signal cointegrator complex subunit 3